LTKSADVIIWNSSIAKEPSPKVIVAASVERRMMSSKSCGGKVRNFASKSGFRRFSTLVRRTPGVKRRILVRVIMLIVLTLSDIGSLLTGPSIFRAVLGDCDEKLVRVFLYASQQFPGNRFSRFRPNSRVHF
jgi:hypothetical protein